MRPDLACLPRFLFFTGKGGVGKTSMACATAVALTRSGKQVLLVSTDPASNLDEVLETPLGPRPVAVRGLKLLLAMNIDPEAAARAYRERIVAPFRGILPEASVRSIEEQLSGACTVEIASFNEFTGLIGNDATVQDYDHVVLDTAPTGHTLRLLALPAAWNDFIATNATGNSCLGPLSGLKEQRLTYEKALSTLRDSTRTLVVLVSRPEGPALKEAARAAAELAELGINRQSLILNGVFTATDRADPLAVALEASGRAALAALPPILSHLPRTDIPFHPQGFTGIAALQSVFESPTRGDDAPLVWSFPGCEDFEALVNDLAISGSGVVMTMGKGGVGKTTIAAAIALELAARGVSVHLSTTDPAAHVEDAVANRPPNLEISRVDPVSETEDYVRQVMATAGTKLDTEAKALLEEELRSPCTEEVAVFQAFARTVARGQHKVVVLDTAPTGHTLLLLDATEAYHREVLRSRSDVPDQVRNLLPRLRDPNFTKVLLVTLPAATPVHEAAQLQSDLRRAGIEPAAWIINQSFAAAGPCDPSLIAKANAEVPHITEVTAELSSRSILIPWNPGPTFSTRHPLEAAIA